MTYTEPIVIVQYNREHFATDDGLRLTLDYDLSYYDQTGRSMISTTFPNRLEGLLVLEGKTPVGREGELRRWLHPFFSTGWTVFQICTRLLRNRIDSPQRTVRRQRIYPATRL